MEITRIVEKNFAMLLQGRAVPCHPVFRMVIASAFPVLTPVPFASNAVPLACPQLEGDDLVESERVSDKEESTRRPDGDQEMNGLVSAVALEDEENEFHIYGDDEDNEDDIEPPGRNDDLGGDIIWEVNGQPGFVPNGIFKAAAAREEHDSDEVDMEDGTEDEEDEEEMMIARNHRLPRRSATCSQHTMSSDDDDLGDDEDQDFEEGDGEDEEGAAA